MDSFHYNIATDGIRAGHKFLSVLGFSFLSVFIEIPQYGGGAIHVHDTGYFVTVVVRSGNKEWKQRINVGLYGIQTLESIRVKFITVNKITSKIKSNVSYIGNKIIENVEVASSYIGSRINNILVNIKSRSDK